jgi:hypothetical protein
MAAALQGAALFLFIPLVLFLFVRQPLGPGGSIASGLALMFGHRLVASPWARRQAARRCAWCARPADGRAVVLVGAGESTWRVAACGEEHAALVAGFLSFVRRWQVPIAAGIFLPLLVLLAASIAQAAGRGFMSHAAAALQFRVIVAITVVTVSLAYRAIHERDASLVSVFPFHNLLLLGIRQTLWVFRVVGAWWLVDGARRLL